MASDPAVSLAGQETISKRPLGERRWGEAPSARGLGLCPRFIRSSPAPAQRERGTQGVRALRLTLKTELELPRATRTMYLRLSIYEAEGCLDAGNLGLDLLLRIRGYERAGVKRPVAARQVRVFSL